MLRDWSGLILVCGFTSNVSNVMVNVLFCITDKILIWL